MGQRPGVFPPVSQTVWTRSSACTASLIRPDCRVLSLPQTTQSGLLGRQPDPSGQSVPSDETEPGIRQARGRADPLSRSMHTHQFYALRRGMVHGIQRASWPFPASSRLKEERCCLMCRLRRNIQSWRLKQDRPGPRVSVASPGASGALHQPAIDPDSHCHQSSCVRLRPSRGCSRRSRHRCHLSFRRGRLSGTNRR
jgi:hypothetical protein